MAFLKKPLKWTALGQEPSELKKSEGFKMDESPAPGHFDFMFRSTYEAIEELQQKAGEVKTINNIQPDSNGNVLITLPDTSKLYQKPASGIPKTDLDATVQASLKKADDAAPLTELAKTNQTVAAHQADNVSHDTYVSCATTGATAEKVVTANGFSLVEGARITVKFANANTATTPTLKINTEVAKPLAKADGTAFKNIKAGIYSFVYSGTSFTVQGEGGEYGTATAGDVLTGKTFGTENGLVNGTLTLASLGGKKWASGNGTVPLVAPKGKKTFNISNLEFTPKYVCVSSKTNGNVMDSVAYINGYYQPPSYTSTDDIKVMTNSIEITIYNNDSSYKDGYLEWIAFE